MAASTITGSHAFPSRTEKPAKRNTSLVGRRNTSPATWSS